MPSRKHKHERSHQGYRPDAGKPTLWRQNPFRRFVPLTGDARQKALPYAWRSTGIRRAKANQNARKHGMFTRDAIEERRRIQEVLGEARKLLEEMK